MIAFYSILYGLPKVQEETDKYQITECKYTKEHHTSINHDGIVKQLVSTDTLFWIVTIGL